jgi:hypothetical protein
LQLTGVHFADGEFPVAGAAIDISSDAPTDRMMRYTDEDGVISLVFNNPGLYEISASLYNEDGINTISRPYTRVMVGVSEHPPLIMVNIDAGTIHVYGALVETEQRPMVVNGVTMVPFRAVAEELGAVVGWNEARREVTAVLYGVTAARFNLDEELEGVSLLNIAGRVYVPVSFIINNF